MGRGCSPGTTGSCKRRWSLTVSAGSCRPQSSGRLRRLQPGEPARGPSWGPGDRGPCLSRWAARGVLSSLPGLAAHPAVSSVSSARGPAHWTCVPLHSVTHSHPLCFMHQRRGRCGLSLLRDHRPAWPSPSVTHSCSPCPRPPTSPLVQTLARVVSALISTPLHPPCRSLFNSHVFTHRSSLFLLRTRPRTSSGGG